MAMAINSRVLRVIPLLIAICFVSFPAQAQYSGGTGELNDPYQIATAEDLMLLGESPEDYDKQFILTADIDLDPNLPGRKVFDKAVIAPDNTNDTWGDFQGTPFTGVFDGHGHNILHLTIEGGHNLGLFGQLGQWDARAAAVKDLGVVDVNINGTGRYVGGLVGRNGSRNTPGGDVTRCYSTGAVIGIRSVGGLVGSNGGDMTDCYSTGLISGRSYVGGLMGSNRGSITTSYSTGSVSGTGTVVGGLVGGNGGTLNQCYNTGVVSGGEYVGGLVGKNQRTLTQCYNSGAVNGNERVGGLVGSNSHLRNPHVSQCYNTGAVNGTWEVGGLVGDNDGVVTLCYSTVAVSGGEFVGGLVGYNGGTVSGCYITGAVSGNEDVGGLVGSGSPATVTHSVWDTQTSGLSGSAGGVGLTTTEMMDPYMLGLNGFANDPNWVLDAAHDYPRLAWEGTPGGIIPEPFIDWLEGQGTPEDPYRVDTADQLILLGKASILCDKHFVLGADIALDPNMPDGQVFGQAVIPAFTGVFDGNGHTISNLTMRGGSYLGLFGQLRNRAEVKNLGVVDVSVTGTGRNVGGLMGCSHGHGIITNCYTSGTISGRTCVGGLIGWNDSEVTGCYSAGTASGDGYIGGLVGYNVGNLLNCYSTGSAIGSVFIGVVGGLVGYNLGNVLNCYSTGSAIGSVFIGGLVGRKSWVEISFGGLVGRNDGEVTGCYSAGTVNGSNYLGGLVGMGDSDLVNNSVWDVETSGLLVSAGGTGLTTVEMMDPYMLGLNGFANDPNWVLDAGHDYPRLAWEGTPGYIIPEQSIDWLEGHGTTQEPYRIETAEQLIFLVKKTSIFWNKHFILVADIDLAPRLPNGQVFGQALIHKFTGIFDGNGHTISHLTIEGDSYLGFFGQLEFGGEVKNLGVVDVNISGSGSFIGGLVGYNMGAVIQCNSTGSLNGRYVDVGGLVGYNWNRGDVVRCYSTAAVSGGEFVGGLVGYNGGTVSGCYSTGTVSGNEDVGGLVGKVYRPGMFPDPFFTTWTPGLILSKVASYYSTATVSGNEDVGRLVGGGGWEGSRVTSCFWDTQTSGQATSAGGTGRTTAEMQTAGTFLEAGWDFVDETANGTEDIWWILEGQDYPRLWWELIPEH